MVNYLWFSFKQNGGFSEDILKIFLFAAVFFLGPVVAIFNFLST
jgi:hypothetical protein